MFRIYPLPPEQEAYEVGGADRFDFGPEPIQVRAWNPCNQPPIAPLENRGSRSEPAAQYDSLSFQRGECEVRVSFAHTQRARQLGCGGRSDDLQTAAEEFANGVVSRRGGRDGQGGQGGQQLRMKAPAFGP